jgi:hypothetical protein
VGKAILTLKQINRPAHKHCIKFAVLAQKTMYNRQVLLDIFKESLDSSLQDAIAVANVKAYDYWELADRVRELDQVQPRRRNLTANRQSPHLQTNRLASEYNRTSGPN